MNWEYLLLFNVTNRPIYGHPWWIKTGRPNSGSINHSPWKASVPDVTGCPSGHSTDPADGLAPIRSVCLISLIIYRVRLKELVPPSRMIYDVTKSLSHIPWTPHPCNLLRNLWQHKTRLHFQQNNMVLTHRQLLSCRHCPLIIMSPSLIPIHGLTKLVLWLGSWKIILVTRLETPTRLNNVKYWIVPRIMWRSNVGTKSANLQRLMMNWIWNHISGSSNNANSCVQQHITMKWKLLLWLQSWFLTVTDISYMAQHSHDYLRIETYHSVESIQTNQPSS